MAFLRVAEPAGADPDLWKGGGAEPFLLHYGRPHIFRFLGDA